MERAFLPAGLMSCSSSRYLTANAPVVSAAARPKSPVAYSARSRFTKATIYSVGLGLGWRPREVASDLASPGWESACSSPRVFQRDCTLVAEEHIRCRPKRSPVELVLGEEVYLILVVEVRTSR